MSDDVEKIIDLASKKPIDQTGWPSRLKGADGVPLPTVSNAIVILLNDPVVKGMVSFNEFSSRSILTRSPPETEETTTGGPFPRAWERADEAFVLAYFQRVYTPRFKAETIAAAMTGAASANRFHPVRNYLSSLKWDGVPRAHGWLVTAFGCPENQYHFAIGGKFLAAAIRRARQLGCKFDTILLLEGEQNIGKSRACRALFGDEWFTDSLPSDLRGRDAADALSGVWGVEFSEVEHLLRSEPEEVKAFLSRQVDRFHPRYGRNVVERPRQCVFIGTTNRDDYARDSTGNRRLWPVRCTKAEVAWIEKWRDQLWAEACHIEVNAYLWLIETEAKTSASDQQAARYQEDPWEERVCEWIVGAPEVSIPEILEKCLSIPVERRDKRSQMRVADILRSQGWRRNQGGVVGRKWTKVNEPHEKGG